MREKASERHIRGQQGPPEAAAAKVFQSKRVSAAAVLHLQGLPAELQANQDQYCVSGDPREAVSAEGAVQNEEQAVAGPKHF